MNWIQVVCFKLKEIWLLFSNAKAKKRANFLLPFHQNMKVWKQISVKRPVKRSMMSIFVSFTSYTYIYRVVWIAQSGKVPVFIGEVLGSNPGVNHIPSVFWPPHKGCWLWLRSWSKMVRTCNSHAPAGSDTLRGLVGRKSLEWYFPTVGQIRFLARQKVIGLSGLLSCK